MVHFGLWPCFTDTERIRKKTFTRIAQEHGKEFPDDLHIQILGRQEIDGATMIVETLQLNITPEEFLDKVRAMEESEMANVKLMHGTCMLCVFLGQCVPNPI